MFPESLATKQGKKNKTIKFFTYSYRTILLFSIFVLAVDVNDEELVTKKHWGKFLEHFENCEEGGALNYLIW